MIPTSNHNHCGFGVSSLSVVYLLIPTSNHNCPSPWQETTLLYIFWFLHQTTTEVSPNFFLNCCISFDSYIKPQLWATLKHKNEVVYLLIPTSNHNSLSSLYSSCTLYIFWFLHQTTTMHRRFKTGGCCISFDSYIKPQLGFRLTQFQWVVYLLIPTSNHNSPQKADAWLSLYIFWFLHQTTTMLRLKMETGSCISFDSYIKPQLPRVLQHHGSVVYLLIPTSNHNSPSASTSWQLLYIFWFLHQTTTIKRDADGKVSCISFDSYIKPQRWTDCAHRPDSCISFDSYIKPQQTASGWCRWTVVYLLIPTSNHNRILLNLKPGKLYIFWFLHQTTTWLWAASWGESCISFDSYIKPQLSDVVELDGLVVYLLIPTSNHNRNGRTPYSYTLYIFWFLHQTTTYNF